MSDCGQPRSLEHENPLFMSPKPSRFTRRPSPTPHLASADESFMQNRDQASLGDPCGLSPRPLETPLLSTTPDGGLFLSPQATPCRASGIPYDAPQRPNRGSSDRASFDPTWHRPTTNPLRIARPRQLDRTSHELSSRSPPGHSMAWLKRHAAKTKCAPGWRRRCT